MSPPPNTQDHIWPVALEIVLHVSSLIERDDIFREYLRVVDRF